MNTTIRYIIGLLVLAFVSTTAFAQSSYTIKPGDALQVEVLEDPNLNRTVLVLPDGSISFPLVGSVNASGRSLDSVRATLAAELASNFAAQPTVFVSIASLGNSTVTSSARTIDVFVMGEVGGPGRISVSRDTTILQILAEAGGLTKFAASKRIELRRADQSGEMKKYLYNYTGRGNAHSISGSTALQEGDVIVVPQRRLFE